MIVELCPGRLCFAVLPRCRSNHSIIAARARSRSAEAAPPPTDTEAHQSPGAPVTSCNSLCGIRCPPQSTCLAGVPVVI